MNTRWIAAAATLVLLAGCGNSRECEPGASIACTGVAGCLGRNACRSDGTGFGACECEPDAGVQCAPGETRPCAGGCESQQTCTSEGAFGACESTCDAGVACDSVSCATGCCNGTVCSESSSASCGVGGDTCAVCGTNQVCSAGACVCNAPFADCDGSAATGCETNLTENGRCGSCAPMPAGTGCFFHASSTCSWSAIDGYRCAVTSCDMGFGNCDGMGGNGCEQALNTVSHCGQCSLACLPSGGSTFCLENSCPGGRAGCYGGQPACPN